MKNINLKIAIEIITCNIQHILEYLSIVIIFIASLLLISNCILIKNVFAIKSIKNIKIGLSLGLSNTTGTLPSISLNTRNYIKYINKKSKWRHKLKLDYTYIEASGALSYLRLVLQEYSKYKFTKLLYFFGNTRYDRNITTGFEYIINENIGAGLKFKISKKSKLFLEFAPGIRQEKIIRGNYYGGISSMFDAKYYYKINKNLTFQERLRMYLANRGGNLYSSFTELSTKIIKRLYLVLEYELNYQTIAPPGFKQFNTISSANIKVKF
jgi:putative salt-induced outer membrane protein YdiY